MGFERYDGSDDLPGDDLRDDPAPQAEQTASDAGEAAHSAAQPERIDSVAAQIKRQLRDEAGGPQDKGFDFQMTLRAGGNELNDTAQEFADESGQEYSPPEFDPGAWQGESSGGGGGAMRVVLAVLVLLALGIGAVVYGIPAWNEYKMNQEQGRLDAQIAERPPLEPVLVDEALHSGLSAALTAAGSEWSDAGADAYVYRYALSEELVPGLSQTLSVRAVLGGADAEQTAGSAAGNLPGSLSAWSGELAASPGVQAAFTFEPGREGDVPLTDDRYIRYGYDYGREHMKLFEPVIEALASRSQYPRVLSETLTDPPLKTNGGFTYVARGFGYLPIYATDSSGNIQMGTGGTLDRMTPREVTGYYLFMYLNDATQGIDFHSTADVDYYTRKIAPLPYDTGSERLHNVALKPDGKPDGIGAIVKNGRLLKDGER